MLAARSLGLAVAGILLATAVAAAPASAGSRHRARPEGPAGSAALTANGKVATAPKGRRPSPAARCPAPERGPQFYAPAYPGYAKSVALTFDDGPGRTTARILRILRAYRAPATFFNIGENMAARPALVHREARDGYLLGNHTWSHPDLTGLSRAGQAAQLAKTSAEQRAITGTNPCVLRPPYGSYDATTLRVAARHRLTVWLWSVDTEDWEADGSGAAYWVDRIVRLAEQEGIVQHHPVILMHNQPGGNPATARALPVIIRFFRHHHYRLVPLLFTSRPAARPGHSSAPAA